MEQNTTNNGIIRKVFSFFKYNRFLIIFVILIVIIIYYAVFGGKGLINRTKLANENESIMEKIKKDSMISLELKKEVDELNNSDKKLEQVAREKYGMVKEGEKIIKIKVDSTKQ